MTNTFHILYQDTSQRHPIELRPFCKKKKHISFLLPLSPPHALLSSNPSTLPLLILITSERYPSPVFLCLWSSSWSLEGKPELDALC